MNNLRSFLQIFDQEPPSISYKMVLPLLSNTETEVLYPKKKNHLHISSQKLQLRQKILSHLIGRYHIPILAAKGASIPYSESHLSLPKNPNRNDFVNNY
jgi:hypothetical protein